LADWLEIPNLRDRANRYLQRLAMDHMLGIEVQPEPYMELGRRILFVTYGVISYFYRWMVTFVILQFMATFLKPYKLEIISNMLALMALGSMVGWPMYRLIRNVHKRGRLPDMKPQRVTLTAFGLALVLLAFFFLPLPVSRIRQTGLVQVHPDAQVNIHVEVPGILQKVHVQEGQTVVKGKILAEFFSPDLESKLSEARAQQAIKENLAHVFASQLPTVREPKDRQSMKESLAKAEGELEAAKVNLRDLQRVKEKLVLRAPQEGVVMGLPHIDEVGKSWDKDQGTPFCSIGDPHQLRVLVPVPPADYSLIQQNLKKYGGSRQLPVTLRVQGRAHHTWRGHVTHLPESEAKTIPPALSSKGGGPLAVKPVADPNQLIPQAQVFLVGVDIDNSDATICPGTMSQVKIHCEYRSAAWWTWRAICITFDLGLL
jgi:putative peptide zinc metalloprotease protein